MLDGGVPERNLGQEPMWDFHGSENAPTPGTLRFTTRSLVEIQIHDVTKIAPDGDRYGIHRTMHRFRKTSRVGRGR